jgi:hypothetical protein
MYISCAIINNPSHGILSFIPEFWRSLNIIPEESITSWCLYVYASSEASLAPPIFRTMQYEIT